MVGCVEIIRGERCRVKLEPESNWRVGKRIEYVPFESRPIVQGRCHEGQPLELQLEEVVGPDRDGPAGRGVGGSGSRQPLQNPQDGTSRHASAALVQDVHVVAGDAVGDADPAGREHVPADLNVPGPALDERLQPLQLRDGNDLVQVHVGFQSLGAIEDESETVQNPPGIPELREELHREVPGDRRDLRVVVGKAEDHPVGGELHGCGRLGERANSETSRTQNSRIYTRYRKDVADLPRYVGGFFVRSVGVF
jgi:hypothetical protein